MKATTRRYTMAAGIAAALILAAGTASGISPPAAPPPAHGAEPKPAAAKPAPKPVSLLNAPPAAKGEPKSESKSEPAAKPASGGHGPAPKGDSHGSSGSGAHPGATKAPAPTTPPAKGAHGTPAVNAPATAAPMPNAHASVDGPTADQALQWLTEGNARWVAGTPEHPSTDSLRREAQAGGQTPFVSILTCADSRIPLERVFDRGVGEVFAVRVAGNVAGTSEGGTLEYGVEHLHTPLLVVMGHTKCGAVAAAASGAVLHGQVGALVAEIKPAVDRARTANPGLAEKELAAAAVKENVWQSVFTLLKNNTTLRQKVSGGELRIVGAIYDVASGKVEFLGSHPWQAELVAALNARDARTAAGEQPAGEAHAGAEGSH
ncbi:MAG: hypothetical protein JNK35_07855 [Phycisphaerae bacterium]|nr:hypothetical protein [Phycisphaerae bacterium]